MDKSSSLVIPMSPQEISKKYKRQSLGCPRHPLLHQQKYQVIFQDYIFIASYTMCYSWSVSCFCFQFCFGFFAIINGWILAFLCGRDTRPTFLCEYSYSSLIFVEYSCLAIKMLLAHVFHAYPVQSLLVFFSYI
jgi:hypothetical protein